MILPAYSKEGHVQHSRIVRVLAFLHGGGIELVSGIVSGARSAKPARGPREEDTVPYGINDLPAQLANSYNQEIGLGQFL